MIANCERIELPKVSAVMPVPSETKKTVARSTVAPSALPESEPGEVGGTSEFIAG